jgi:hypothetical protein
LLQQLAALVDTVQRWASTGELEPYYSGDTLDGPGDHDVDWYADPCVEGELHEAIEALPADWLAQLGALERNAVLEGERRIDAAEKERDEARDLYREAEERYCAEVTRADAAYAAGIRAAIAMAESVGDPPLFGGVTSREAIVAAIRSLAAGEVEWRCIRCKKPSPLDAECDCQKETK